MNIVFEAEKLASKLRGEGRTEEGKLVEELLNQRSEDKAALTQLNRMKQERDFARHEQRELLSSVEDVERRIGPARLPESIRGDLQAIINKHRIWGSRHREDSAVVDDPLSEHNPAQRIKDFFAMVLGGAVLDSDEEPMDDMVVFRYMGNGASDALTVGDLKRFIAST